MRAIATPVTHVDDKGWLDRALSVFTDVRAGEGVTALLMLLKIFLLLICYSVIKAAREPLSGPEFDPDTDAVAEGNSSGEVGADVVADDGIVVGGGGAGEGVECVVLGDQHPRDRVAGDDVAVDFAGAAGDCQNHAGLVQRPDLDGALTGSLRGGDSCPAGISEVARESGPDRDCRLRHPP